MMSYSDISNKVCLFAEDVCTFLLKSGEKHGNYWCAGSVHGERGDSLKVSLSGPYQGKWKDFNGGDKGDLLDLWAASRQIPLKQAYEEVKKYLGIPEDSGVSFTAHKKKIYTIPLYRPDEPKEVYEYLQSKRGLQKNILEMFHVKQRGQNIVFNYFRDKKLTYVKYLGLARPNGKKLISIEKECEPTLYGWDTISPDARHITICEGEIDCMSLRQYGVNANALSVPMGASNLQWIENDFERIDRYDKYYLCLDNDEAGREGVKKIIARLGREKCYIVTLPHKDANDCLLKGISQTVIHQCFKDAKSLDPEELKRGDEFLESLMERFYPSDDTPLGYDSPWSKVNQAIHFRPGELSVWTGINGHGKSQFLGNLLLHWMKRGAKACVASLELEPSHFLFNLTKQASGLALPTHGFIEAINEWFGDDKLWIYDIFGCSKSADILEVFKFANRKYGIDVFVIDSFSLLDIADDDYKSQKEFMTKLVDFKKTYQCHIHLVIHPRKGVNEKLSPNKMDFKGSGSFTDLADNCFSVWRNKEKEIIQSALDNRDPVSADQMEVLKYPDARFTCSKQRMTGNEGIFNFWFDKESLQYKSNPDQKCVKFVHYSSLDKAHGNDIKVQGSDSI